MTPAVIPGRPEGPDPESRCILSVRVWIPGSLAALAPRNDSYFTAGSAAYEGFGNKIAQPT